MTTGPAGIDLLPKPPRSLPSPAFALDVVDGVIAYRLHWDGNPLLTAAGAWARRVTRVPARVLWRWSCVYVNFIAIEHERRALGFPPGSGAHRKWG